jgi:hypothetical protein
MRPVTNPITAGLLGSVATGAAGSFLPTVVPPTVVVLVGAVVAAVTHLIHTPRRAYRVTGAVFLLGTVGILSFLPGVAREYRWSLVPSALWFGVLSTLVAGLFVVLRRGGRWIGRRLWPEDVADAIADAISAVATTLLVAYTVVQTKERLARSGIVGVLGTGSLIADVLSYRVPVSLGVVEQASNLTVVTFVGSVAVGFYTLASWDASRRVAGTAVRKASDVRPDASSTADPDIDTGGDSDPP